MSAATMEKDRVGSDVNESPSEGPSSPGEDQPLAPQPRPKKSRKGASKKKQQQQQQQQDSGSSLPGLDSLPTGQVTKSAEGALGGVTNALGSVANNTMDNAQQQGGESGGGGKSDTLRLRLDLNLEIEIQLKARIHGDLELALL